MSWEAVGGQLLSSFQVNCSDTAEYRRSKVTIDQSDIISITIGTTTLSSDDCEILEDTYQNNVKKGTAKVTIRGKNSYGNEKQITFKIITKSMANLE